MPTTSKNPLILVLRYLLLFLQVLLLFQSVENQTDPLLLAVFGVILLNQIRWYVLREDLWQILLILAELALLFLWPAQEPLHLVWILAPGLFDLAAKHRWLALVYVGFFVFRSYNQPFFWVAALVFVVLLILFIAFQYLVTALAKAKFAQLQTENRLLDQEKVRKSTANEMQSREELAILRERNRISRDIHDSVGHGLSTIHIQLQAIQKVAPQNPALASEMAGTLAEFSKDSLAKIRTALRELKPQSYSAYETVLLLEDLCRKTEELGEMRVHFRYTGDIRKIGEKQSQTLLALTQEFLANSARHGQAQGVWIHLHFRPSELIYSLEDNGVGCPPDTPLGIGLRSMEERVRELRGSLTRSSQVGEGFRVRIVLPLTEGEIYG